MHIFSITSVICLSIAICSIIFTKSKDDIFTPNRLYLMTYGFTFGIATLKMSSLSDTYNLITYFVIAGSYFCFFCGTASVYLLVRFKPFPKLNLNQVADELQESGKTLRIKTLLLFVFIYFIVFLISYFFGYLKLGYIPAFAEMPNKAKDDFIAYGKLAAFLHIASPAVLLLSLAISIKSIKNKLYLTIWLFITGFLYIFILSRPEVLRWFFSGLLFINYYRRRIDCYDISKFALLILFFLMITFAIRLKEEMWQEANLSTSAQLHFTKNTSAAVFPYLYIANNYWNLDLNLQRAIEGGVKHTYGFQTFRAVFSLVGMGSTAMQAFNMEKTEYKIRVKGMNTIPFHWSLFLDFGFPGIFIGNFLGGILLAYLYSISRRRPSHLAITSYIFFSYCLVFSFFSPIWYYLLTWITGFCFLAVQPFLFKNNFKLI